MLDSTVLGMVNHQCKREKARDLEQNPAVPQPQFYSKWKIILRPQPADKKKEGHETRHEVCPESQHYAIYVIIPVPDSIKSR